MFKTSLLIRKNIANKIFDLFEKSLFLFTKSNKISGYIVVFFHYLFVMFLYLLLISQNMIYYLIGTFAWIQLILAHIFFNGCIFIRLERHLWNTEQWYGPWILLLKIFDSVFKINKSNTPHLMRYFYLVFTGYIIFLIFRRGYYFLYEKPKEKINKKDDEEKNTLHKQLHLESPPNDLEYPHPTNDQQFLEIKERQ